MCVCVFALQIERERQKVSMSVQVFESISQRERESVRAVERARASENAVQRVGGCLSFVQVWKPVELEGEGADGFH